MHHKFSWEVSGFFRNFIIKTRNALSPCFSLFWWFWLWGNFPKYKFPENLKTSFMLCLLSQPPWFKVEHMEHITVYNDCTESTKSPNQNIHGKCWQNRTKIAFHFKILVLCWKKNYNTWKVDGATPISLGYPGPLLRNFWKLRHLHALRCIETRIDLESNRFFSNFPCQMLCQVPPVQSFWVSLHHSHPLSAYQYCWPVRLPCRGLISS